MKKDKRTRFTLRLPPDLHKEAKQEAMRRLVSLNRLVNWALAHYLTHVPRRGPEDLEE